MVQPKDPKRFSERFLGAVTTSGFGVLGKRDLELLMFYLLEQDGAIRRADEAHRVASLLRTTASKVNALRRDAYARWSALDKPAGMKQHVQLLRRIVSKDAVAAGERFRAVHGLSDSVLPVRVPHAADREMFEGLLAEINAMPDYRQNRLILLVPVEDVVDLADFVGLRAADPAQTKARLLDLLPSGTRLADILKGKREDSPTVITKMALKEYTSHLMKNPVKFVQTLLRLAEGEASST